MATVKRVVAEAPRAKTIVLDVPHWPGHRAGQYVDVRITDAHGYRTERSYSLASAPEERQLTLTVERICDGEVSRYLTEELRTGDKLELRGPSGAYFNWRVADGGPLLPIARGSGLVPLMAMLRHRAGLSNAVDARLLLSVRSSDAVLYRDELATLEASGGLSVHYALTRDVASCCTELAGCLQADLAGTAGDLASRRPRIFVCGSGAFIGAAVRLLAELGFDPATIRAQDVAPAGG